MPHIFAVKQARNLRKTWWRERFCRCRCPPTASPPSCCRPVSMQFFAVVYAELQKPFTVCYIVLYNLFVAVHHIMGVRQHGNDVAPAGGVIYCFRKYSCNANNRRHAGNSAVAEVARPLRRQGISQKNALQSILNIALPQNTCASPVQPSLSSLWGQSVGTFIKLPLWLHTACCYIFLFTVSSEQEKLPVSFKSEIHHKPFDFLYFGVSRYRYFHT